MGDDATGPMDLIAAILRFHHILEARLDGALNGCGLSFAQYEVMEVLVAEPKLHAGELGRRLHITWQSAHGLLKTTRQGGPHRAPSEGRRGPLCLAHHGRGEAP